MSRLRPASHWLALAMLLLAGCARQDESSRSAPPAAAPPSDSDGGRPTSPESAPLPLVGQPGAPPQAEPRLPAPSSPPSPTAPTAPPARTALVPRSEAARRAAETYATIRVFYGTNRRATGDPRPTEYFGRDPGPLTLGYCDVSMPRDHQAGELESPKLWKFEFRPNPEKHVVLLSVRTTSQREFVTELQRSVWESLEWRDTPEGPELQGGEAFVFVHGFNNSFEDAARRTAQMARDLRFRGPPVMYSWPSAGGASLRGYQDDAQRIAASEQQFREFLSNVARESGARRIHVIAHSMGNRLVSETLRQLSSDCRSGLCPKFNQVILTAPDIDAAYFRTAIAPRIVQTADRVTIYSSARDLALRASSFANQLGPRRLGDAGRELITFPDLRSIEIVDASDVDTDLFSLRHSYHAESPTVLTDMAQVLAGLAPGDRGLQSLWGALAWRIRDPRGSIQQAVHATHE